jgi:hypothetical protein
MVLHITYSLIGVCYCFCSFYLHIAFRYILLCFSACQFLSKTCSIFCFIMSCCMWMPVWTQRGIATWSPAGIYMQYSRYGKNSFRFAASALWNSFPDHFRTENSFSQFKSLLQSWIGSKCRCSACRWLTFCFWFAYIFIIFLIIIFF